MQFHQRAHIHKIDCMNHNQQSVLFLCISHCVIRSDPCSLFRSCIVSHIRCFAVCVFREKRMHYKNTYCLLFCVFISFIFHLMRWVRGKCTGTVDVIVVRLCAERLCMYVFSALSPSISRSMCTNAKVVCNAISFHIVVRVCCAVHRWVWVCVCVCKDFKHLLTRHGQSKTTQYGQNENKPKRRKSVDELRWQWTDVHFSIRYRWPVIRTLLTIFVWIP